jgi:integrase
METAMVSLSRSFQECRVYLLGVRGYAVSSLDNYERTWSYYLAYLRQQGLGDEARHFTTDTVIGFRDYLAAPPYELQGSSILNKIHALSTLARFMMTKKDGRGRPTLPSNPTLGFERPRTHTPETKFLLPDELRAFMTTACHPGLDFARRLMLDTGIRCLEACEANAEDLCHVGDTWMLRLKVKGRRQAGGEPASIPVSPPLAILLTRPSVTGPLLTDTQGRRWRRSQLTQAMIRLGHRAGITRLTTSPHRLRHTANVLARMAGVDPLTRASMLNHRSMRSLARYDSLVPGEVIRGREKQSRQLELYLRLTGTPHTTNPVDLLATDESNS